ncbi:hypothetical protein FRC12_003361 [Ceratobasidium sp. 428]|nr:hypothetical protein FRC12_003361 [Ceratobasidium sp. 428]
MEPENNRQYEHMVVDEGARNDSGKEGFVNSEELTCVVICEAALNCLFLHSPTRVDVNMIEFPNTPSGEDAYKNLESRPIKTKHPTQPENSTSINELFTYSVYEAVHHKMLMHLEKDDEWTQVLRRIVQKINDSKEKWPDMEAQAKKALGDPERRGRGPKLTAKEDKAARRARWEERQAKADLEGGKKKK